MNPPKTKGIVTFYSQDNTMEGMLVKITKILAVFFMLLAAVLNLNVF